MDLETPLLTLVDGSLTDVVVQPSFISAGCTVVTTCIHRTVAFTDVKLPKGSRSTLLGVQKRVIGGKLWLVRTDDTVVIEHGSIDMDKFNESTELCAGVGASTLGFHACGVETKHFNDQSPVFAKWLQNKGKNVIEGDVADPKVVSKLASVHGGILSAGVSCQPWSTLGDQQAFRDERSKSLPGTLRIIHLLQIPLALMECTPAVQDSAEAQAMFRQFEAQTGTVIHQKVLSLHSYWPARRQRWWATVSHHALKIQPIPEIPPLAFQPSLLHLLPRFMTLHGDELMALKLDDNEMENFLNTKRGMVEHQVDNCKALPTATHSWGSQLRGCECGCRKFGFSKKRIESKGLYGQLIPLAENYIQEPTEVPRMRHLHACEVAVANGLDPFFKGFQGMSPRLALAAVGQMATPFQSAWVLSNALWNMKHAGFPVEIIESPILVLKKIAADLFHARDRLLGTPKKTEIMMRFELAVELWGHPDANDILVKFQPPTEVKSIPKTVHLGIGSQPVDADHPGNIRVKKRSSDQPLSNATAPIRAPLASESIPGQSVQSPSVPGIECSRARSHFGEAVQSSPFPGQVSGSVQSPRVPDSLGNIQPEKNSCHRPEHKASDLIQAHHGTEIFSCRPAASTASEPGRRDSRDRSVFESALTQTASAFATHTLSGTPSPMRDLHPPRSANCPTEVAGSVASVQEPAKPQSDAQVKFGGPNASTNGDPKKSCPGLSPPRPDAMPLPRLGCGGPSRCQVAWDLQRPDQTNRPVDIKGLPTGMICEAELTDERAVEPLTCQSGLHKLPHEHADSWMHQKTQHMSPQTFRVIPAQVFPTHAAHAMPLPRLGCGGPSLSPAVHRSNDRSEVAELSGEERHPDDAMPDQSNQGPPKLAATSDRAHECEPHSCHDKAKAHMHRIPKPSSKFDLGTHVPPTRFHAMPLPRLGCGGPSQMDEMVQQSNPKVTKLDNDRQFTQEPKGISSLDQTTYVVHSSPEATGSQPKPNLPEKEMNMMQAPLSSEPRVAVESCIPDQKHPNHNHHDHHDEHTIHVPNQDAEKSIQFDDDADQILEQGMIMVCQAIEAQSEAFQRGCVPGFGTGAKRPQPEPDEVAKRRKCHNDPSPPKDAEPASTEELERIDQTLTAIEPSEASECPEPNDPPDQRPDYEVAEVFVISDEKLPQSVKVPWGQTAGQLLVAHAKIANHAETDLAINTAMATQIPLAQVLAPGSVVVIDHVKHIQRLECQAHLPGDAKQHPIFHGSSRENLLWKQQGWVAVDEMEFYVQMVSNSYPGSFCKPRLVNRNDVATMAQAVIDLIQTVAQSNSHFAGVPILTDGHWSPVGAMPYHDKVAIWTTRQQAAIIRAAFRQTVGEPPFEIFECAFPHHFPADCGFQTLGWLISLASLDTEFRAVNDQQASHWRMLFHQFLVATCKHMTIHSAPLQVGGMNGLQEDLIKLIVAHGVASARSQECADAILSNLGASTVQRILQAPKPWTDLKARASLCKPPIRIVLPEELQTMIKDRALSDQPTGKKNNKIKHTKPGTAEIRLKADQIVVPHAVFKQQDGIELGQLTSSQINASARGILVVNYEDALPYFAIQRAITTEGMGLLVLDHHDPRLPNNHTVVRVPALCKATSEPLIATAAMFQLGHKTVMRNLPEECIEVQETPYAVVRISLYRDQTSIPWEAVTSGPVKQILQLPNLQSLPQTAIMDVWDRQFLDDRLKKADPSKSAMALVNIRIDHRYLDDVLACSGTAGCYTEHRTSDGRAPHPDHQVVWLPKKSFAEATVAQQSNPTPCKLTRSGNRYGLRVAKAHAEQTHMMHRPEVIYLQGNELLKFKVGPLPFGSSKASIATLFRKWNWQARPLGPIGPTRDKSGIMWNVQSTSNPENWIYQASHGDILIAPEGSQQSQTPNQQAIIASEKTLQSLAKATHHPNQETADPWLHDDPWRSNQPASASATLNPQQFAELEDSIEKKLAKQLQSEDKMDVDADRRVTDLENKVSQIAQELTAFQHHQSKQQQTIQHQIATIDAKVDNHQQAIHTLLDTKLETQMARIEQLFAKRAKTGQE